MGQLLTQFGQWLMVNLVQPALTWFKDVFLWIPKKVWAEVLDGLATAIEAIPVPDAFAPGNIWAGIAGDVGFFLGVCEFPAGVALIVGAYAFRFLVRRIPFVG